MINSRDFKVLARRIYPLWGLIQGHYRETRIAGECILNLRSFYDPASNRLFVALENHRQSFCLCPERNDDPDVENAVGAVYDMDSHKKLSPFFGDHWSKPALPVAMRFDKTAREFIAISDSYICWNDLETGKVKQKIQFEKMSRIEEAFFTDSKVCAGGNVFDLRKKKATLTVPWPENIHVYDEKHQWVIAYFNSCLLIYKAVWRVGWGVKRDVKLIDKVPDVASLRRKSGGNFEYLPDTQRLVCLRQDSRGVIVLDLQTKGRKVLDLAQSSVECLVRASSHLIMALQENKRYRFDLYDLATMDRVSSFPNDEGLSVIDMQYDPKTGMLLTNSMKSLSFWDVPKGVCLKRIPHPYKAWYRVEWDAENKTIALHLVPYFQAWQTRLIRY
ncbi:MAG: hypothetical protein LLG04_04305 [Parachlamydia sp.]|nr:hypothetical protein [Parachlamydia sp.]